MSYQLRFGRNAGFVGPDAQARLRSSVIAVAGAGGDGGQVAIALARMGVGAIRLADPENFEIENTNRQAGCRLSTLGRNKASVVGEICADVNPEAAIDVFDEGVTSANVADFVRGADLVVDETDYASPEVGVLLAREARRERTTVCMALNVGYGCLVTTFTPDGVTLEDYLGIDAGTSDVAAVPLWRWAPRIPGYVSRGALEAVAAGEIPAPSVSPGVLLAAGALTTQAFCVLTGRGRVVHAPHLLWIDAMDRSMGVIRNRRIAWWRSMARMMLQRRPP